MFRFKPVKDTTPASIGSSDIPQWEGECPFCGYHIELRTSPKYCEFCGSRIRWW